MMEELLTLDFWGSYDIVVVKANNVKARGQVKCYIQWENFPSKYFQGAVDSHRKVVTF